MFVFFSFSSLCYCKVLIDICAVEEINLNFRWLPRMIKVLSNQICKPLYVTGHKVLLEYVYKPKKLSRERNVLVHGVKHEPYSSSLVSHMSPGCQCSVGATSRP